MKDTFPKSLPEEQTLWDAGKRIDAIKAYRDRTGEGLAEAYCALKGITAAEHMASCRVRACREEL